MSGLSIGALVPNLKSVALTLTEILAFNEQILGSRDPGYAHFLPSFDILGVGGR